MSTSSRTLRIIWEGPLWTTHSLALVNQAICLKLVQRGHEVACVSSEAEPADADMTPAHRILQECSKISRRNEGAVHISHQWPPNLTPPATGPWVIIQPWEYGSLPRAWLKPMTDLVDEVWVYSRYVRECYLTSGIPADRVHVVPVGVDTSCYCPDGRRFPLRTTKRFKFLFVGGTIARKGIDVLLEAYIQTFTRQDNVCLVIKDMGVNTFYRGQTAEQRIAHLQSIAEAPEIEYIERKLTHSELAGLYRACDALALPYRGEGFGLPIAEAMACGLPVVVTGFGAALDFCNDQNALLIPASVIHFPQKRVGDLETVDYPWLAEPDLNSLKELLRRVVDHADQARARGAVACEHIRRHFTWDHAVDVVERRLLELRDRPIRRFVSPIGSRTRQRVSLCMMVKNEEPNLSPCLNSVADLVDEIILVDTGSTDRTKELASQFASATGVPVVKLYDFAWIDNFAAARNETIRHATGDWIFWLDADDRLDEENRRRLRALFAGLKDENAAYVMKCLCLPDPQTGGTTVVDHVRLFRNHPDLRWEYRVHEQILGALRRQGADVRTTDIVIHHTGYQNPSLRDRKLQRDLRLLRLEDADHPDDPFTLFNLGSVYRELGRTAEALPLLRRSLERSHPTDSIVRKLYALIVQCHGELGQPDRALLACGRGLETCPDDVELLYTQARLLHACRNLEGAKMCLLRILQTSPASYFASVDPGLRGYKARQLLGEIYRDQGRHAEAEEYLRAALAEQPNYAPAWLELAELFLTQGRWKELEHAIQELGKQPPWTTDVAVLRARGHLARKEFGDARRVLEELIAQAPKALYPRRILSHVLLQEGRDWDAAEKVLRNILWLDPNNAEARRNLDVLLRQQAPVESRRDD